MNTINEMDEGMLNQFASSLIFRLIARFLIITQITLGIQIPVYAATASVASLATTVGSGVSVGGYKLISSKRITRTLFEYTYSGTINNQSGNDLKGVAASVASKANATTVIEGNLTFGNVASGASVVSQDTFTIRQDRTFAFNPDDLTWTVTAEPLNQKPVANAGSDQSVEVGRTVVLDGSASSDADGDNLTYSWSFAATPCPATLNDANAVQPSFTVNCPGNYVLQLVVSDGQASSLADEVIVSTINTKPVANAGVDQTVAVGEVAMLDGSASSDVDGDALSYQWSIVSAPVDGAPHISDVAAVKPELTFNKPGSYVIQLLVNDGEFSSEPDLVVINTSNSAPIANAGADRKIVLGELALLDGSASSDVDGDALIFKWSLLSVPTNSSATLSDPHAVKPSIDADLPGVYVAQLIVNDGSVDSAPDTVTLTTENNKPVANAGPDRTVPLSSVVTLNGSASTDIDHDALAYHWSLVSKPQGSLAELNDPNLPQPQFEVDIPGSYVVQLIVNDGQVNSDADTVTISTENSKPVANAGPDQTVIQDKLVQLDGSASSDADADPMTYQWSFVSQPQNSGAALSDPATQKPTFTPQLPGLYVLQLIVNDGTVNSDADTVSVTVDAEKVTVPNVVGLTQADAGAALTSAKLTVGGITQQSSENVPAGQVIGQNPGAGLSVDKGSAVGLVVSTGPAKVAVPPVVGATQAAAQTAILAAKLAVGAVTQQSSNTVPVGGVIGQSPLAGTLVNIGSAVDLVVSTGPQQISVPSVIGLPQADAEAAIVNAQLSIGAVTQQASADVPAGNVVSQTPIGGALTTMGTAVDLVVSSGASPVVLAKLDLTPKDSVILVGQNQAFVAIGTNSDGTGQVMTNQLSWESSNTAVATVDASGVLTALQPGQTVLRASQGGIFTTTTVTVTASVAETTLPVAVISTPSNDQNISAPITVIGTASDANFLKYVLEIAASDQSNFTTIATGNASVVNGALGTLDPTLLLNDIYTLRLTVYDKAGNVAQTGVSVQIGKDQKVGNFSLAFEDLNVPVAGIPMTVTRVYDSRDKSVGDFGYGWRLDVQTLKLSVAKDQGKGWQVNKSGGFFPTYTLVATRPHKVSINLPDGRVEEFDLALQPSSSTLLPFLSTQILTPQYKARAGTFGKLEPLGNGVMVVGSQPGSVELVEDDFFFSTPYQPTDFRYTNPEGRVFTYQNKKLVSILEPNGNSLTIGANGIIHSSGKSISFARDAQGRIEKVTDPNGNVINYGYDSQGNLASHQDPENNTTRFKYNFSHGLLEVQDPRGLTPLRNEYDDAGRLIRSIDSSGNAIEYSHDLNNQQEVIRDRLGNLTVHEYDAAGNVVKTIDATGGITQRSYDARGNVLTETDPLGRVKTFTYDARDNRLNETDALGNVTAYSYNARNQVLTLTDPLGHVTSNVYDANGNLTSTTDALGNVTTNTYDGKGNLTSITDALNNKTTYQYNAAGNVTQETDALGHATTYSYDANGNRLTETKTRTRANGSQETLVTHFVYDKLNRQVKTTYPDGSVAETHYNAIGKQSETIDQLGHKTLYEYDALGRLSKTAYPDGSSETISYDVEGRRISSVDRAGGVSKFVYDSLGRQTQTIQADGSSTSTVYDHSGQIATETDALGHQTSYEYDAAGRRVKTIDALGQETLFAYDAAGNQIQVTDAKGNVLAFAYDQANRRTQVIYPDGTKDITTFDGLGRVLKKTDQAGVETRFEYDVLGRLALVIDALNNVTAYGYDELGNRVSQTDANGHTTRFGYDSVGRRTSRMLPLGQTETMAYDAAGNLASKTDFNGKTSTYTYDALNRLLAKKPDAGFNEAATAYTYTASGQRATMTDASGVTTYGYDNRDRLIEKAAPQGTLSYAYDSQGNLTGMHSDHGDGVDIGYQYDALNRLSKVTDLRLVSGETVYQYDAVGNLASYAYPNGVTTSYTYNSLNRLTDLQVKQGAVDKARYGYTLGATGNRTQVHELSGRTVQYAYDPLYRLLKETINGVASPNQNGIVDYVYDPVGNRLQRASSLPAISAQTLSYDANDRLSSDSYDDNGNTTGANGKTYGYDSENRLISQNGNAVGIVYDGDGNRVAETVAGVTTEYLIDTLNPTGYAQVVEELQNGQVVHRYSYGLDLVSQSQKSGANFQTHFYGYDGHGSVRFLTDTTGLVTDRYDYDAFGNLINKVGTTPNKYLYSGEQLDGNVGYYYLRARYLDENQGRFNSMDFYPGKTFQPLTLHKYLYANGDPVDNSDPSGYFTLIGLNINISLPVSLNALAAGAARVTANRLAGKALERFVESQLQRFVTQYGGQVFRQVYFRGPGGIRFADAVVKLGNKFVAIEVKTNIPLAGRALARLGGQIKTYTSGVSNNPLLSGTASEVILITEQSAAEIEAAFLAIENQVASGTLSGVLQGTTGLITVLRGVLLGI